MPGFTIFLSITELQKEKALFPLQRFFIAFSASMLLIGRQKEHIKLSGGMLAWLSVWGEMQGAVKQ